MPKVQMPHWPTLVTAVIAFVIVLGLYHIIRKKG